MKWGVRKEEDYHSDYSKEQRDRDKTVYGRGGVKRINKNMKKGDKISTALNTVIAGFLLTWLEYDAEAIAAGASVSAKFQQWIWPLFMIGPAIGAALYIIPLLFIKYPQSLKEQVTKDLHDRRMQKGEITE